MSCLRVAPGLTARSVCLEVDERLMFGGIGKMCVNGIFPPLILVCFILKDLKSLLGDHTDLCSQFSS